MDLSVWRPDEERQWGRGGNTRYSSFPRKREPSAGSAHARSGSPLSRGDNEVRIRRRQDSALSAESGLQCLKHIFAEVGVADDVCKLAVDIGGVDVERRAARILGGEADFLDHQFHELGSASCREKECQYE